MIAIWQIASHFIPIPANNPALSMSLSGCVSQPPIEMLR
jgi:hypothetical protein